MKKIGILFGLFMLQIVWATSIDDMSFGINNFSRGDSGVAYSDRWQAGLMNPALLAVQAHDGMVIENSRWFMDTQIQQVAGSFTMGRTGINLGFIRLGDDGTPWTSTTGTANGTIQYSEYAAYAAMGQELMGIDSGLTLMVENKKALAEKNFYSVDAGFYYDSHSFWAAGIHIKNIAGSFEKNDKCLYYVSGVHFYHEPFSADLDYISQTGTFHGGVGYATDFLALNGGIDPDGNYSAGLSVSLGGVNFEYGCKNSDLLGVVNRFSIGFLF